MLVDEGLQQSAMTRNIVLIIAAAIFMSVETQAKEIDVRINGTRPIYIVNYKSPSFAVGMNLFKYNWTDHLSNAKLLTLAKALGPSYIRMGGTKSDHATFHPNEEQSFARDPRDECVGTIPNAAEFETHRLCARIETLRDEFLQRKGEIINVTYTGPEFDDLLTFVKCSKWNLIFGLNLLQRRNKKWDPTNSNQLLQYAKERRYFIDWELGNEPNSYFHKTGVRLSASEIAKDFFSLNNILRGDAWWKKSKLIGPDSNTMMKSSSRLFLKKFLHFAGTVVNAATFHQYYVDSKTATTDNFTDYKILNTLKTMVKHVVKIGKRQSPGLPVWLGETSSSYGGGAEGLSDTYVAGFMWLDKLGICASLGIDTVFRQTLLGGRYAMINDNLDPNPDYWLTLLYKLLVGPKVLNVSLTSSGGFVSREDGRFRVYAHCTNVLRSNYSTGSITLYYLNLSRRKKSMSISPYARKPVKMAMAYILTPYQGKLNSSYVNLNDKKLEMIDDRTLPELRGKAINLGRSKDIKLPQLSFGFIVLPDIAVAACL